MYLARFFPCRNPFNLGLIVEHKMFPYMLMCEGQVRPCQTRQGFTYPLQLPPINFLSRLCILVVSWRCRWFQGATVGLEVNPSFTFMNAQVMLTSSSGPSVLRYVINFTKLFGLPLSVVNEMATDFKLCGIIFTSIFVN